MNKNTLLVLEIIWTSAGILSIIAVIKAVMHDSGNRVIIFALMAAVSFFFAWLRHRERKKN